MNLATQPTTRPQPRRLLTQRSIKYLQLLFIAIFGPAMLLGLLITTTGQEAAAQTPLPPPLDSIQIGPAVSRNYAQATEEKLKEQFGQKTASLQIPFIKNEGQADDAVAYYAKTFGGTVFVTHQGEIVYSLPQVDESSAPRPPQRGERFAPPFGRPGEASSRNHTLELDRSVTSITLKESIVGGVVDSVAGQEEAVTKVSYFKGSDASQWQSNLPTYNSISLGEVYPGIELKLAAHGHNVEKIFVVKPGADPKQISLQLAGAEALTINPDGELQATTTLGPVSFTKPLAYQEINGKRVYIEAAYTLTPNPKSKIQNPKSVYGFSLDPYNPHYELIIDPLLASTFFGGGSGDDWGTALTLDSSGNVYVTGRSYDDVFIAKLDSNLSTLSASTFLGGSGEDSGSALTLDGSGNVYVAGYTYDSTIDFPMTGNPYDDTHNGGSDVFIAKLDSNLSTLSTSTFLGGSGWDDGFALTLDGSGNVYVTGFTEDSTIDFPMAGSPYDNTHNGSSDVFIAKLDSNLNTLSASTFLGGSGSDYGYALNLDGSGNVYVTGFTDDSTTDFPMAGSPYDNTHNGDKDVFIAKLDSNLSSNTSFLPIILKSAE